MTVILTHSSQYLAQIYYYNKKLVTILDHIAI